MTMTMLSLGAASCASPDQVANRRQDILRDNARALAANDRDYSKAVEWNTRVLGLPASGALTLMIIAIVGVVVIAVGFFVYRYNRRVEEIRFLNNAPCSVCGADYTKRTEA